MAVDTSLKEVLEENTIKAAPELVRPEKNGAVRCLACGHRCLIRDGKAGVCKVRFNRGGELRAPGGYVAGLQVDPIEKKPFYHAFPGHNALSFGMLGCDLHCSYCQNWVTSQALRDDRAQAPPRFCDAGQLVDIAVDQEVPVVVSTYNEPLITADWAVQVFEKAQAQGILCGFVSNGNATPEVLDFIGPYAGLYKVDLKSFRDKNYRQLGCTLHNVLDSIHHIKERGFWLELLTLVIPGFNDSDEELRDIAQFIAGVGKDIPWHITAFHPDYKMTDPPATPAKTLIRAYDHGKEAGLHFVYPGNLPGQVGAREHTYCPDCEAAIIRRRGFYVLENRMKGNQCPDCSTEIPGVWQKAAPKQSLGTGSPVPVRL